MNARRRRLAKARRKATVVQRFNYVGNGTQTMLPLSPEAVAAFRAGGFLLIRPVAQQDRATLS